MKKAVLLVLFISACALAFSQETGREVFARFVSKLKAEASGSSVLLSWRNPKDVQASPVLYRHTSQIGADNLNQAELIARLAADTSSYEDKPTDARPYYYAVLLEDADGSLHSIFVPFRNRTSEPVSIAVLPSEESLAARVSEIEAEVAADAMRVSFQSSNPDRDLLLFRSDSAILTADDLLSAFAPVQLDAGTTRYFDYPIPGVEYYYAVIDAGLFKLGKQQLMAGENSTVQPVALPLEVGRVGLPPVAAAEQAAPTEKTAAAPITPAAAPLPAPITGEPEQTTAPAPLRIQAEKARSFPLPFLQLPSSLEQGRTVTALRRPGLPTKTEELGLETRQSVDRILAATPPLLPETRSVEILPVDRGDPSNGESAGLQKIIRDQLLTGNFRSAEAKLQGFLNLRRTAYTEARVRFYLAQAYYFQGLYQEALLEFVLAQDQLYASVQPWLSSCFRQLKSKKSL